MPAHSSRPVYQSGDCEVDLARREMRAGGVPIPLGSHAFELIEALVQSAGNLVTKSELMARIWPGVIVEENTLQVHVSAVRKALGPYRELLKTESGRGYRLLGSWTVRHEGASAVPVDREPTQTPTQAFQTNLPATALGLIGRTAAAQQLQGLLAAHRLVTLIGPGGIGKTVLAQEVGRDLFASIEADAWFVGLVSLSDPDLVPSAVAGVLGLKLGGGQILAESVARAIGAKKLLLVLDNCEHVIGSAAELAETVVRLCPRTTVLATSREILRVDGEYVYRVPPLDVPPPHQNEPDAVLEHSAVELFVARTQALDSDFSPRRDDLLSIAAICRHLDGIPLAIEFAAARAATLGLPEVEARLEDRFGLLTGGRRTALPRHQTLHATLDWSYELLPASEQMLLRRLAIFSAGFTLEAAVAVAGDDGTARAAVADGVANLVAKSLATRDGSVTTGRWRLLETIRAYALEKLAKSGETEQIARRHAEFFRNLLAIVSPTLQSQAAAENIARHGREIDNVRSALAWAFSPTGDVALGVGLAAVAMDFWIALSLLSECCDWGLKAVAQLGAAEGTRDEMMLQCGLGKALTYSRGMQVDARVALTRALELAEALGDDNYQFRTAYILWLFALRVVDFRECLALACKCELLAQTMGDPAASAIANFAFGQSRYYLGEHAAAAANLERARATYPIAMRSGDPILVGADFLTCSLCYQAVTFWSLGFAERAFQAGRDAIREARSVNHPVSLCTALAAPSSILLVKMGYLEAAERCIDELIDHSEKHSLTPFHAFGLCSKGGLMAARGDITGAERLLRLGLQRSREVAYYLFDSFFEAELAAVLASAGRVDEGLVEINTALRYAEESESLWCMPEILRIKGELLAKRAGAEGNAAEEWFIRSCEHAKRQEALSWELRPAMSLARFWRDRDRSLEAYELLDRVYRRFTEGFDTADLQAAKGLLNQLS